MQAQLLVNNQHPLSLVHDAEFRHLAAVVEGGARGAAFTRANGEVADHVIFTVRGAVLQKNRALPLLLYDRRPTSLSYRSGCLAALLLLP